MRLSARPEVALRRRGFRAPPASSPLRSSHDSAPPQVAGVRTSRRAPARTRRRRRRPSVDLDALRALVAKALGAGYGVGRSDLTLNEKIWLRGLCQQYDAERSRRYGNEPPHRAGAALRPRPRTREQAIKALRVIARCFDKELAELDAAIGEPPRRPNRKPPVACSRVSMTKRRRARPRERRARRARSPGRSTNDDEADLDRAEAAA
jgi:hypothetical protein